jgi:hypothetical protein
MGNRGPVLLYQIHRCGFAGFVVLLSCLSQITGLRTDNGDSE